MSTTTIPRPRMAPGRRKRLLKERTAWLTRSLVMWALAVLFLMPFLWMVSASLKRDFEVFAVPIQWWPAEPFWQNYARVWTGPTSMVQFFLNSGLVVVARVVGELIIAALAGYAFGRLKFKGRNVLFGLFVASMIVPGQLLLVPQFMFFRQLGLYDSLWAIILPSLASAFGIFLLRQHFASAPAELGEAARIDGASELRIFTHIYLPMAKPMLAAYAILVFDSAWNDYERPLVMLSDTEKYTVPLGLTQFIAMDGTVSAALSMAGSVSSALPVLAFFLIFQRHFISSMARAGMK